jgi:hypothetical protein
LLGTCHVRILLSLKQTKNQDKSYARIYDKNQENLRRNTWDSTWDREEAPEIATPATWEGKKLTSNGLHRRPFLRLLSGVPNLASPPCNVAVVASRALEKIIKRSFVKQPNQMIGAAIVVSELQLIGSDRRHPNYTNNEGFPWAYHGRNRGEIWAECRVELLRTNL